MRRHFKFEDIAPPLGGRGSRFVDATVSSISISFTDSAFERGGGGLQEGLDQSSEREIDVSNVAVGAPKGSDEVHICDADGCCGPLTAEALKFLGATSHTVESIPDTFYFEAPKGDDTVHIHTADCNHPIGTITELKGAQAPMVDPVKAPAVSQWAGPTIVTQVNGQEEAQNVGREHSHVVPSNEPVFETQPSKREDTTFIRDETDVHLGNKLHKNISPTSDDTFPVAGPAGDATVHVHDETCRHDGDVIAVNPKKTDTSSTMENDCFTEIKDAPSRASGSRNTELPQLKGEVAGHTPDKVSGHLDSKPPDIINNSPVNDPTLGKEPSIAHSRADVEVKPYNSSPTATREDAAERRHVEPHKPEVPIEKSTNTSFHAIKSATPESSKASDPIIIPSESRRPVVSHSTEKDEAALKYEKEKTISTSSKDLNAASQTIEKFRESPSIKSHSPISKALGDLSEAVTKSLNGKVLVELKPLRSELTSDVIKNKFNVSKTKMDLSERLPQSLAEIRHRLNALQASSSALTVRNILSRDSSKGVSVKQVTTQFRILEKAPSDGRYNERTLALKLKDLTRLISKHPSEKLHVDVLEQVKNIERSLSPDWAKLSNLKLSDQSLSPLGSRLKELEAVVKTSALDPLEQKLLLNLRGQLRTLIETQQTGRANHKTFNRFADFSKASVDLQEIQKYLKALRAGLKLPDSKMSREDKANLRNQEQKLARQELRIIDKLQKLSDTSKTIRRGPRLVLSVERSLSSLQSTLLKTIHSLKGKLLITNSQANDLTERVKRYLENINKKGLPLNMLPERQRRIYELQLMLKDSSEISQRLLNELMELVDDEVSGVQRLKKNGRIINSSIRKHAYKKMLGLNGSKVEVDFSSSRTKEAKSPAPSRATTNLKTGNVVSVASKLPSRSLDVVQSKEDDNETNEYVRG